MKKFLFALAMLASLVLLASCFPVPPARTHTWGEWTVTREPSCALEGERTRSWSCGEVETGRIAKEMHERGEWVITTEPTCTTLGQKKVCCIKCGVDIVTTDAEIQPHDYRLISTTTPTCTEEGYSLYECEDCHTTAKDDLVDSNGHAFVDAVYHGDATAERNGTATGYCTVCEAVVTGEIKGSADLIKGLFKDKKVSVIGDSISTYVDVSNGKAASTTNSMITKNSLYYSATHNAALGVSLEDTWWMRTINALGAELLVNNSDSGSYIKDSKSNGNPGAYVERAENLHDNTGNNAGTEPDIVFVYLGTNDFGKYYNNFGDPEAIDYESLGEKTAAEYVATSVAEAYAIMLYKITTEYVGVQVYCLNVLDSTLWGKKSAYLADFNDKIAAVAEHFGAHVVDIYNESGIKNDADFEKYIPSDDGDDTANTLHPNAAGFALISDVLLDVIIENTENYPTAEDFEELANNQ